MKMDIIICTYNSEKYLDACINGVKTCFPVNRILVIDHYSKDGTISIAKRHSALVFFENSGRAFALNLGISKIETEIFAIVDSDVVLDKGKWVNAVLSKFVDSQVGGVGLCLFSDVPLWLQRYAAYHQHVRNFREIKGGTWVNAYVIRTKALGTGFQIPQHLNSYEHIYLKDAIIKNGYKIDSVEAEGTHYYDYPAKKGYWLGAGERTYCGLKQFVRILFRQFLLSPIKAIPPALAYRDANVILGNTRYWTQFLIGYLKPAKYIHMNRD